MKQLTVKDIYELSKKLMHNGHGDKTILVSDDEECNGVHGLYFGFRLPTEDSEDHGCPLIDIYGKENFDKLILLT